MPQIHIKISTLFCCIWMACLLPSKAQNLWLGMNAGLSAPISRAPENGTYYKGGIHDAQPMWDVEAQFLFANKLAVNAGFLYSNYPLGLKRHPNNYPKIEPYAFPATIDLRDLRLGIGYDLRLLERIRFVPELSLHLLLGRQIGYGYADIGFRDGTRLKSESDVLKPSLLPAISAASSFHIRLRNGMFFRVGCRLQTAFSNVGRTRIEVRNPNGNLIESHDYAPVPMILQPNFGFHYPISRIWHGKPW